MDTNFVEFWRDFFMRSGESRKAMENLTSWMRQGFTGFEQMTALFQKAYGLDRMAMGGQGYFEICRKARDDFKKSFSTYLGLLGVVPRDEHLDLVRRYEELKEEILSREETISNLRTLLAEERKVEVDQVSGKVQDLVQRQAEQFQKMMESFGGFLGDRETQANGPAAEPPKTEGPRRTAKKKIRTRPSGG